MDKDWILEYYDSRNDAVRLYKKLETDAKNIKEVTTNSDIPIHDKVQLEQDLTLIVHDRRIVAEMINDLDESIINLETGKHPGNKRGIERQPKFKRRLALTTEMINAHIGQVAEDDDMFTSEEKEIAEKALKCLTDRQKEVFVRYTVLDMSFANISRDLDISRPVAFKIYRASQKKIKKFLDLEKNRVTKTL